MTEPASLSNRAKLLMMLRQRTGASLAACREALDESGGDVDAATEALRAQQPPVTWFHGAVRDDRTFALLLELAGTPSDAHRPELDALITKALLAEDDEGVAAALKHPAVLRFVPVRLPHHEDGLVAIGVVEHHAAAVVLGTVSSEVARSESAVDDAENHAWRALLRGFRFANVEDVPRAGLDAWRGRARGIEADEQALLQSLVLSREREVARRLSWDEKMPRRLLAVRRLDRGRDTTIYSLRDVSTCFQPGPFAVVGRSASAVIGPGALVDFSHRVQRWGDKYRVPATFVPAGVSSRWHVLPHDVPLFCAFAVGIVVARGSWNDVTKLDRKACIEARDVLRELPEGAWSELARVLPEEPCRQLVEARDLVYFGAVGPLQTHLVFGMKGTDSATRRLSAQRGGPYLEFYKAGEERDLRAFWPGARGELVALAEVGTTASATFEDHPAHMARSSRLPRMSYYLVPSFEVEPDDLVG
ncbi:Hypothetical protein A7982_00005 [Minicystis rosea]|nr:Hypothetical protein A7982_00005 [Minicystis rosea]